VFEELLARLRALTRRAAQPGPSASYLKRGALEMNTLRRSVRLDNTVLDLRPKEYALLEVFMRNPDQVLSRTLLAERVWGDAFYVTDNVMDVSMSRLRQKLADARGTREQKATVCIETVRGVGYRLVVENSTEH
jgi:DNA-binding response OmpR family regulator